MKKHISHIFQHIDFFKIVFSVILLSILYKVFRVPMTHDEVATTVLYYNFSVWEIMMYPDNLPNNHILNTLATKFFITLFGKAQWVVRLPSVLSFVALTYGVYRLSSVFFKKDSLFIIAVFSLFVSNAYFLDFFSLSRGYAMAAALMVLSASYLISGYTEEQERDIGVSILWATLASYANFTLLVFWITILILSSVYFLHAYWNNLKRWLQRMGLMLLFSIAYLGLIYNPLHKMTSTNQFKFWTSKGFYEDTIVSLIQNWKYGHQVFFRSTILDLSIAVLIITIISALLILSKLLKKGWSWRNFNSPLTLAFLIFGITILINIAQTLIMKTPNLSGRTALFFYPLFSLLLIGLLAKLENIKIKWVKYIIAIGIPILAFLHLGNTYNPTNVKEWAYDENTCEILTYLEHVQSKDTVTLKTNWFFHPSFDFYNKTGKTPFLQLYKYDKKIDPNTDARYYYVFDADVEKLAPRFKKIKSFGNGERWLMERKWE